MDGRQGRTVATVVIVSLTVAVTAFFVVRERDTPGPGTARHRADAAVDGTIAGPHEAPSPGGDQPATREVEVLVGFRGDPPVNRPVKTTPECGGGSVHEDAVLVRDGGLANVLVRVREGAPPDEGRGQGVEISQEGCVYSPRVSGIVAGQSIAITSKDAFLHNVHTFAGDVSIFNKGQPFPSTFVKHAQDFAVGGEPVRDGPIAFRCDVHPWMLAWVVVNPNRYFAVTGPGGRAALSLPPGRLVLEAWHEVYGTRTAVLEAGATQVTIEMP